MTDEAKNVANIVQSIAEAAVPGGATFNVQICERIWTITMELNEEMTQHLKAME